VLRDGRSASGDRGLCLNVCEAKSKYGTRPGDRIWVTECQPEHPLTANSNWTFAGGRLLNVRSGLCASGAASCGR
jgi:hypothetical protein